MSERGGGLHDENREIMRAEMDGAGGVFNRGLRLPAARAFVRRGRLPSTPPRNFMIADFRSQNRAGPLEVAGTARGPFLAPNGPADRAR
jgi:hypothetical protein